MMLRLTGTRSPVGVQTWTVTLAAGTYLCQFAMSAVAKVLGLNYINLQMDGVNVNQSKLYANELTQHAMMNQGVSEITIPADGEHTFTIVPHDTSTQVDQNDFGWIILTPCAPGAVT